jgi:hypothetical protein
MQNYFNYLSSWYPRQRAPAPPRRLPYSPPRGRLGQDDTERINNLAQLVREVEQESANYVNWFKNNDIEGVPQEFKNKAVEEANRGNGPIFYTWSNLPNDMKERAADFWYEDLIKLPRGRDYDALRQRIQREAAIPINNRRGSPIRRYEDAAAADAEAARQYRAARIREAEAARIREAEAARMREAEAARMREAEAARMREAEAARIREAEEAANNRRVARRAAAAADAQDRRRATAALAAAAATRRAAAAAANTRQRSSSETRRKRKSSEERKRKASEERRRKESEERRRKESEERRRKES